MSALQQVVRVYTRRYEFDKAAVTLEKILKMPQGLKSSFLKQLAEAYNRTGESKKALATIRRWKTLVPNDKQAWLREVDLLEYEEGPASALKALRRGVERFEGSPEIYSRLAGLYLNEKKYVQARAVRR